MSTFSSLQEERQKYEPKLPSILQEVTKLTAKPESVCQELAEDIKELFPRTCSQPKLKFEVQKHLEHRPLKIGVVLSGGQAAGGHNVILGVANAIKQFHPKSCLFGFLNGPSGIVDSSYVELTDNFLKKYRNQGGFDMIGAGRTKIETEEQFEKAGKVAKHLTLDGIVIIGGDDSNTNAALLAEYFLANGIETSVVGVPKTIDGDLKNEEVEISFGFDTATKTFSETIGSILRDSLSAKKYYFFIKLMGRSASHIALECALQTHPNMALIGEEVQQKKQSLKDLTVLIADMICRRQEKNKNYGVILLPEGLIEFIPEFEALIEELNPLTDLKELSLVREKLSNSARRCFDSIPKRIQEQLLLERDPHGNIQVSKIETDRLFVNAVSDELNERKSKGLYRGSFHAQPLFCGYEGRSCYPSNFDASYCFALGVVAALLIDQKKSGYMSVVQGLSSSPNAWKIAAIPLTSLMHMEKRKGKMRPVIKKKLVDLEAAPFKRFKDEREKWMLDDDYRYPGPIQFFGPPEITDAITKTLEYET